MLVGCFDTETTGNQVEKDRIIELALIIVDSDTWEQKLRYERRYNPGMKVNPKAFAIHGIADSDLMGCPSFADAAPLLMAAFAKVDLFVGHNIVGFDFPILAFELNRVGATMKRQPEVCDTMLEGKWATPDGKQPTLGELCWSLDVPYDATTAHAALADVEFNLAAFKRGLELGYFHIPAFH